MILERLSQRERILFIGTVSVIALAVGYNLILEPLTNRWQYLNRQITQKSLKLTKNQNILKRKNRIKEEFDEYARHVSVLGTDEEAVTTLLKIIEEKATLSAARITNIRPKPARSTPFYKEFVFEVISESSLEQLLRFIYELQNSEELLKVKRLSLTLKGSQSQTIRGVMEIIKISVE